MTSLFGNLAVLLLFLEAWPFLQPHLFTHAASTAPPVTHRRITFNPDTDEDYDDDYDNHNHSPPPEVVQRARTPLIRGEPRQFCSYDPCSDSQEPCAQLKERTGCLCPGVSGADEIPQPPRIHLLQPISKGEVEVHWCAPSSVVTKYKVVIEERAEGPLFFGNDLRRGFVGSLEVGKMVCVEAVNKAGSSAPTDYSCKRYDRAESSTDSMGLHWVIGGGVALLLLLIIGAVVLWRYQVYRKAKRDSSDGLGNPSYSTEGTL